MFVVFSDISEQTLCPIFDGQAVQEGHSSWNDLRFNVGTDIEAVVLRNMTENISLAYTPEFYKCKLK